MDKSLPLAKLGLAQIDLIRNEHTNAISLLESTLQDVSGWMDALKVHQLPHVIASVRAPLKSRFTTQLGWSSIICDMKLVYSQTYMSTMQILQLLIAALLKRIATVLLRRHYHSVTSSGQLSLGVVGCCMQILGNLYPHNPGKAHKAVSHFKDAASRSDKDPEVWEMLGELLAATDPSGHITPRLRPSHL